MCVTRKSSSVTTCEEDHREMQTSHTVACGFALGLRPSTTLCRIPRAKPQARHATK